MRVLEIDQTQLNQLEVWAGDTSTFTKDQLSLCIALQQLGGNAMPSEITELLNTTEDVIRNVQSGISGILVDGNTGRFWIR